MSIGIYKITSPTNRVYIGQSINIEKRWKGYKYIINLKGQPKLLRSFQKYGYINHTFEIIEECSLEQLNERETYWKLYYLEKFNNNLKQVLFHELYDLGGGPKSEETKLKISKKLLSNNNNKPILQYDLEGNFIKEWKSITEINNHYNLKSSIINKCCLGYSKSSINFQWKYKNENIKYKINPIKNNYKGKKSKKLKKVGQYDLDGNLLNVWESAIIASKKLNINTGGITACCRGEDKTYKTYIWKYIIN